MGAGGEFRLLSTAKEANTEIIEEKQNNEIKYLVALSVLREIYKDNSVSREVLERLNKKNAEVLGCKPIPLA